MSVLKTEMNRHKHVLEVSQLSIQLSISSCCLSRNIVFLQYRRPGASKEELPQAPQKSIRAPDLDSISLYVEVCSA